MNLRYWPALLWGITFLSVTVQAVPVISVSADPSQSRNGEPVLFRVRIQNDNRDAVDPPRLPQLADWEIINASRAEFPTSILRNGKILYRYQGEFTYVLKPLRKGTLKIPSLELSIGATRYKTDSMIIIVDQLPNGAAARPRMAQRPAAPSQPDMEEEDPLSGYGMGGGFGAPPPPSRATPPPNSRESFFLRAEPSKTNVYQGELIVLSYVLYQKEISIANAEIAKFPDFQGFLKEELLLPKTFTRTPIELQGQPYYRSELLRYAVFPLKSGLLKIDPMVFKAEFVASPQDIINGMLRGQMPQNLGSLNPIPMSKSSEEIKILSKNLPPAPAGSVFTGGVGQFKMDIKAPTGRLSTEQPFTIQLTVAGRGNVKAIEEPPLKLPATLEAFQTKNSYEFREDATGYKTFEYLINPHAPGSYSLEPIVWTYFDPQTAKYVQLKGPPIQLQIEGSAAPGSAKESSEAPPPVARFGPIAQGAQNFLPLAAIDQPSFLGSLGAWGVQLLLYAYAALLFFRRRQFDTRNLRFRTAPWEKTEEIILNRSDWPKKELANLVDQWIRERLAGYLRRGEIHRESPRDEIFEALRNQLHPEKHRDLDKLKHLWGDLDLWRFSGSSSASERGDRAVFGRAKTLLESLMQYHQVA